MKHLPLLLIIAALALASCSKDESIPQYVAEPIPIWKYKHTFTYADEWIAIGYSSSSPVYYTSVKIEDWSYGRVVQTNLLGGIYLNGALIHSYKDGSFFHPEPCKRGDLVEYDNYTIERYFNGEHISTGIDPDICDILDRIEIFHPLTNSSQLDESSVEIRVTLNERPQPGDIYVLRFEMVNYRRGVYLE